MLVWAVFLGLLAAATCDDYIDHVDCEPDYMVITLNDESSMANATYKEGHMIAILYDDHPLSITNCSAIVVQPNHTHTPDLKFVYSACGVTIVQPVGGDGYVAIPLRVNVLDGSSADWYFEASCTYPSQVTIDWSGAVTVPSGGGSGGDHGGSSGSSVTGLTANWFSDGKPIDKDIVLTKDERITFKVEYTENSYAAFMPVSCYISNQQNLALNTTQKIPFVFSSCPSDYAGTFFNRTIGPKLFEQVIKPVKFTGSDLLWAQCTINLCVREDDPSCKISTCWTDSGAKVLESEKFLAMPQLSQVLGDTPSSGNAYASLYISDGGNSGGKGGGGSGSATIVGAALGSILVVLVVAGLIVGAIFMKRNKTVEPSSDFGAPPVIPYQIPRAKYPESVNSINSTVY